MKDPRIELRKPWDKELHKLWESGVDVFDRLDLLTKHMEAYLRLECPHYFGAPLVSMQHSGIYKVQLFDDGPCRVSVWEAKLDNYPSAYGVTGTSLIDTQMPISNVYHTEEVRNSPEIAARAHILVESQFFGNEFWKEYTLEQIAEILEVPQEVRIKLLGNAERPK